MVITEDYKHKLDAYLTLLDLPYNNIVEILLKKYGPADYDYFSQYSYDRFQHGKIKTISASKKSSRTNEGLYCHHIDENKYSNMSSPAPIKLQRIPFKFHKKDRLVYCDLIEHMILHTIIAKETNMTHGFLGYEIYMLPCAAYWYVYGNKKHHDSGKPLRPHELNWFNKSFLPPNECKEIIDKININLYGEKKELSVYSRSREEINREWMRNIYIEKESLKYKPITYDEYFRQEEEKRKQREEEIIRQKMLEDKEVHFNAKYPKFKEKNITPSNNRQYIITQLYKLKYSNCFKTKKEFNSSKVTEFTDSLFDELYDLL